MKSSVFLDITPCSPLKVNRRFGGTYRLHLRSRRLRLYVPPKRPFTFNGLHGVISQEDNALHNDDN
jgi:hypothetical protein